LNALKRVRRQADRADVKLSDWEGEFLGSVEERVKTYGRAFGDPEKGGRRRGPLGHAGRETERDRRQGQGREKALQTAPKSPIRKTKKRVSSRFAKQDRDPYAPRLPQRRGMALS
jgi:hypothetical protein